MPVGDSRRTLLDNDRLFVWNGEAVVRASNGADRRVVRRDLGIELNKPTYNRGSGDSRADIP